MTSTSPLLNCRSSSNRFIGFTSECKYAVGTPCSTKKAHRSSDGQQGQQRVGYARQIRPHNLRCLCNMHCINGVRREQTDRSSLFTVSNDREEDGKTPVKTTKNGYDIYTLSVPQNICYKKRLAYTTRPQPLAAGVNGVPLALLPRYPYKSGGNRVITSGHSNGTLIPCAR